jgi:hypothetical protein
MSEGQTDNSKPYDPMESFRGMRDAYLDAMAKTMVEAVNTDAYAQASGAMLDTTLSMSAPFREALEKTMLQVLQQLSLPSRQDIIGLAERFTNLEMRLDDMDASLSGLEGKVQKSLLPLLQQLLMLTEALGNLIKRVDSIQVKVDRLHPGLPSKSTAGSKAIKTRSAAPATVGAKATRGRKAASKQTQPKKRAARKGAR